MNEETREQAIRDMEDLLTRIDELALEGLNAPVFLQWKSDTEDAIRRIFGDRSREVSSFVNIRYTPLTHAACLSEDSKTIAFQRGLGHARFVLQSMIQRRRQV